MTHFQHLRFGIDLGTTNSCVARADGTDVRVYQNNDQMSVTPSVVRVLKTGRIVTGKRAYNAIVDDPDNVAREFKRIMGQKGGHEFPAAKRSMTAEELSSEIIKAMRDDVARADGIDLRETVVTVPAAFGALQCDATSRACALAGLRQAPLLQEPLAAAIAYGIAPGSRDQHWMVFDLGGGTLDIAVISTRDGRLTVLEHRGNNLLGGKDIDHGIVEKYFVPALSAQYLLPDRTSEPTAYERLRRRLRITAEQAKIDLTSSERLVVSLIDLGDDGRGDPIELELTLTRADLELLVEPVLERALRLAEEALAAARVAGNDLDRVLMVGGPTQMPYVRTVVASRLSAKVDFSLDPMTVVARGAALYAQTVEIERESGPTAVNAATNDDGKPRLRLAFDPVSARSSAVVAGKIDDTSHGITEIKIDADGGYWMSGWQPLTDGAFELPVTLQEGKACRFFVYARDAHGTLVDVEPDEFSIRHGLVVAPPPLPHTIGIEIVGPNGRAILDPQFKRGTPLPAERTARYRADKTCAPGDPATSLAIKLWEGEDLADAAANSWVGNANIEASAIRRAIPEGSEIELTIKINASRLIAIEAFVPHLNQHFSNRVYIAQQEEQDYGELAAAVPKQLVAFRERLEGLKTSPGTADGNEPDRREELRRVEEDLHALSEQAAESATSGTADPDQAKRVTEAARSVRSRLTQLETSMGVDSQALVRMTDITSARDGAKEVVQHFGNALEKKECQMLERQLERALDKSDERALEKLRVAFRSLWWRVLSAQDWWWREVFESLRAPGRSFVNRAEAVKRFGDGEQAIRTGDGTRLRAVVEDLWKLQPEDEIARDKERAVRSGLRKH